eukprot:1159217-Pelagomonas_calceolata.AAC.1
MSGPMTREQETPVQSLAPAAYDPHNDWAGMQTWSTRDRTEFLFNAQCKEWGSLSKQVHRKHAGNQLSI